MHTVSLKLYDRERFQCYIAYYMKLIKDQYKIITCTMQINLSSLKRNIHLQSIQIKSLYMINNNVNSCK